MPLSSGAKALIGGGSVFYSSQISWLPNLFALFGAAAVIRGWSGESCELEGFLVLISWLANSFPYRLIEYR